MPTKPTIVFFGSFQHYSTKIIESLVASKDVKIIGVVTTPPHPAGRKKILTKTHTHAWAEKHDIPVFTPEKLSEKVEPFTTEGFDLKKPDFFVVTGYGQILPRSWLSYPKVASLNLHFSLLPKYRGANPAEWAILMGERETGVTLIKMDSDIDTGPILAQEKLAIVQSTFQGETLQGGDTRESLYEKLYALAAKLIVTFFSKKVEPFSIERFDLKKFLRPQPKQSPTPYATRLQRSDGFIPWPLINSALLHNYHTTVRGSYDNKVPVEDLPPLLNQVANYQTLKIKAVTTFHLVTLIERSIRALAGFPGIWTTVRTTKGKKRLKLLSAHLQSDRFVLDGVQLEGKAPSTFNQIKNQIIS